MAPQTIYYDNDCMMCRLYTKAMLDHGVLVEGGRKTYQEADKCADVDLDRARNEIALVDHERGTVRYGVHSFLALFAGRFPRLARLFNHPLTATIADPLYKFISYNRKVISPPTVFEGKDSCTPDFKMYWRMAYILLGTLVTGLILTVYGGLMHQLIGDTVFGLEIMVCTGQILFQTILLKAIGSDKVIHYLGNMVTISLVGALGLLPIVLLSSLVELPMMLLTGHFFFVVWLMFREHIRRVKYLELPWYLTLSWVTYRLIVLLPLL